MLLSSQLYILWIFHILNFIHTNASSLVESHVVTLFFIFIPVVSVVHSV